MKYAIIGAGAVGGYYGSLLAKNNYDVHFLVRSDYEYLKKNGLTIESKNGNFKLPLINVYNKPKDMPLCDVVIVSLKATENDKLKHILSCILKKKSIVVLLQNGIGVEKDIADMFPDAIIVGGLCFLCSNKIGPGHINHLDYGAMRIGEYKENYNPAGVTDNLKKILEVFQKAGIDVQISENIGQARWEKLVWNVPFNGLSVILNATTLELINSPSASKLAYEIMLEVIGAANKCGYNVKNDFADLMISATKQMIDYKPSMKLDFENNRPLEINEIYLRPLEMAKQVDFFMPKTSAIALELQFLNDRLL